MTALPTDQDLQNARRRLASLQHAAEFNPIYIDDIDMREQFSADLRLLLSTQPSRPQGEEGLLSFEAQLAERLNDPEWLAKWNSDEQGLVPFHAMLTALRREEGDSITLLCDNPDFNGLPNNAVECCGAWTDWKDRRFTGDSLLLAVRAAYLARLSNPQQGEPSS